MDRLAIKRLTASDLTFFEALWRSLNAGNQKSINLNSDVFVLRLYPGIPGMVTSKPRFPIDLNILGPGGRPTHNVQRKIMPATGSYKNWRLNGEFVVSPTEDPERYSHIRPGDHAVFDFDGDTHPEGARLAIVSADHARDAELHTRLASLFVAERTMIDVTRADLRLAADGALLDEHHSFWAIAYPTELLELPDLGEGLPEPVYRRGRRPRVPKSSARNIAANAQAVGDLGEELVSEHLSRRVNSGEVSNVLWVSLEDAYAPLDFSYNSAEGLPVSLDVKTTVGGHESSFYLSRAELEEAVTVEMYLIYRVSSLASTVAGVSGVLRIGRLDRDLAGEVLSSLSLLPDFVSVPSIQFDPSVLEFSDLVELTIDLSGDDDPMPPAP